MMDVGSMYPCKQGYLQGYLAHKKETSPRTLQYGVHRRWIDIGFARCSAYPCKQG